MKFVLKNTRECTKSHQFFEEIPDTPSLAPSELNFTVPVEITWVCFCNMYIRLFIQGSLKVWWCGKELNHIRRKKLD